MWILKNVHEPLPEVFTFHTFHVSCICWFSIRCPAIRDLEQCRANSYCKRATGKSSNAAWGANHCLTGQVFFMQNYFVWCDNETNITNYWLKLINSFIPLACAECDDSLPFSGACSIPVCYVLFPATLLHQLFFHPPSLHLASISWSTSQSCSQIHI